MKRRDLLLNLLPFFVALGVAFYFIYLSIGWNVVVAMSRWTGLRADYTFMGFEHFMNMFQDPVFHRSLFNTLFLFMTIPITMSIGLLLAVLLDVCGRGSGIFRNIFLLPFALSFVVTATMWAWMYAPSNGVINTILTSIGMESLAGLWHTSENSVMWSILLALVWQFSGYSALIFLAGMKSVPEEQTSAAQVDGASPFRVYTNIVIPQLTPSFLTNFVIMMLFSLKAFDFIWVLTSGGPGTASHTLPIYIYRVLFEQTRFAYGSAISTTLLIIVLAVVVPYLYTSNRRETS